MIFYNTKVITKRRKIDYEKKLILASNRSRLISLRNLRKGWSTFLPNYPRGQTERDNPWQIVEFFHLLCSKVFCVGLTLFHMCILLKISSSVEYVKWLFKNILTKLILKIEEISITLILKQNLLVLKTALV